MAESLQARVAIVTGASSGIGEATAELLAGAGAKVALAARRTDRLEAVAARIAEAGGTAVPLSADMADPASVEAMVAEAREQLGPIDILVNNAGVMHLAPVEEAHVDDWRQMLEVNAMGLMVATRAVLGEMKRRKSGHVVNIASSLARETYPVSAAYSLTKWGLVGFSDALRKECREHRVRVTVVEPGATTTELHGKISDAATRAATRDRLEAMRPMTARDVAEAVLFAVTRPSHVNVFEILMRSIDQP